MRFQLGLSEYLVGILIVLTLARIAGILWAYHLTGVPR
jgi:hypothetical protein